MLDRRRWNSQQSSFQLPILRLQRWPGEARGENDTLAVVLPVAAATTVAAANLATALVVSAAAAAAANVSEATTDTTQVQKDLEEEESIGAQHFDILQQQHY